MPLHYIIAIYLVIVGYLLPIGLLTVWAAYVENHQHHVVDRQCMASLRQLLEPYDLQDDVDQPDPGRPTNPARATGRVPRALVLRWARAARVEALRADLVRHPVRAWSDLDESTRVLHTVNSHRSTRHHRAGAR